MTQEKIYRGDLFFANLNPVKGSEQGGKRPVVILQNDVGNKFSPTVIVAAITSRTRKKANMPTHVPPDNAAGASPADEIGAIPVRNAFAPAVVSPILI